MTMTRAALVISTLTLTLALPGCSNPPSDECVKYVDCQAHFENVMELDSTDLSETYGEGGTCWTLATTADSCTSACADAVNTLKENLEAAGEELGPCG